jgi:hypothetical protein
MPRFEIAKLLQVGGFDWLTCVVCQVALMTCVALVSKRSSLRALAKSQLSRRVFFDATSCLHLTMAFMVCIYVAGNFLGLGVRVLCIVKIKLSQ